MLKLLLMMLNFLLRMLAEQILAILREIIETAIEAGATTVNIPDTTGYTFPFEYGSMIAELKRRVKNINKADYKCSLP